MRNRLVDAAGTFLAKVAVLVATVLGLVVVSFFAVSMASRRMEMREDLVLQGRSLAKITANGSRIGVFVGNPELLEGLVAGVMEEDHVLRVRIFAADAGLLIDRSRQEAADRFEKTVDTAPSFPRGGDPFLMREGRGVVAILFPVTLEMVPESEDDILFPEGGAKREREIIGHVEVTMDTASLARELAPVAAKSASVAALLLLAGIAAVILLGRRLTRPLSTLTEAVRSFGRGEREVAVPVTSHDEVGRLSEAFNAMASSLRKREEEKRRLEARLREAAKMEAVGTLARGVAHDFNNIISTITGVLHLIEKRTAGESPFRQYTERIAAATARAQSLVGHLMDFSRTGTVRPRPMDLNALLERIGPELSHLVAGRCDLSVRPSGGPLPVMADALQVEQVIVNLCTNGRDAMPEGGRLTIATGRRLVAGEDAEGKELARGEYALLEVADEGPRINEATRERIFEPFYTTKEVGRGTGLGLSIVYGIVAGHGGRVALRSRLGEGTVFTVYFPLMRRHGSAEEGMPENGGAT